MAAKLSMGTCISWAASSLECQLLLSHSTQELRWDLALVVLGTLDLDLLAHAAHSRRNDPVVCAHMWC